MRRASIVGRDWVAEVGCSRGLVVVNVKGLEGGKGCTVLVVVYETVSVTSVGFGTAAASGIGTGFVTSVVGFVKVTVAVFEVAAVVADVVVVPVI
jgi:hypothetical protein